MPGRFGYATPAGTPKARKAGMPAYQISDRPNDKAPADTRNLPALFIYRINYSVIRNSPPSPRPKTSGKYIWEAWVGMTRNSPGMEARME